MENRGRSSGLGATPPGGQFDMGRAGGLSPAARRIMAAQNMQRNPNTPSTPTIMWQPPTLNGNPAKPQPPRTPTNEGYVPTGMYAYRGLSQQAPMAVPTPIPTPPEQPTPQQPATEWGHGNVLIGGAGGAAQPPAVPVPAGGYPASYTMPPAGPVSSHKWTWGLIALLLVCIVGAIGWLLWQSQNSFDPQKTTNTALSQALNTQTYEETLTIKNGNTTQTIKRQADFSKVNEPRLYFSNVTADLKQDQTEMIIINNDYYAKRHFSAKEIAAASAAQKTLLGKINNKWVQLAKDNKLIKSDAATAVDLPLDNIAAQQVIIPAIVPIGAMVAASQQKLTNDLINNKIFTAGKEKPVTEAVNNQPAWKMNLSISIDNLTQFNIEAAKTLGYPDTSPVENALKSNIPSAISAWVRQADSRIVRYSYNLHNINYTYDYAKINDSLTIPTPTLYNQAPAPTTTSNNDSSAATPPPAIPASDDNIQSAVDTITSFLQVATDNDTPPPANAADFKALYANQLTNDDLAKLDIEYNAQTPTKVGQIFYHQQMSCAADGSLMASDQPTDYAIVGKLSNSLYCQDNVN